MRYRQNCTAILSGTTTRLKPSGLPPKYHEATAEWYLVAVSHPKGCYSVLTHRADPSGECSQEQHNDNNNENLNTLANHLTHHSIRTPAQHDMLVILCALRGDVGLTHEVKNSKKSFFVDDDDISRRNEKRQYLDKYSTNRLRNTCNESAMTALVQ